MKFLTVVATIVFTLSAQAQAPLNFNSADLEQIESSLESLNSGIELGLTLSNTAAGCKVNHMHELIGFRCTLSNAEKSLG